MYQSRMLYTSDLHEGTRHFYLNTNRKIKFLKKNVSSEKWPAGEDRGSGEDGFVMSIRSQRVGRERPSKG